MSKVQTFDLAIIGAGSGGLSVAAAAAMLDVKVALIESHKMGGDCLNYGCVPSKSLLASAKIANHVRQAGSFGVHAGEPGVDIAGVMQHVAKVIKAIEPHDSVERFEKLGVTVFKAEAKFVNPYTVQAGDTLIRAKRFIVATGSSPAVPPITGLGKVPYFTNETIFNLTQTPRHLIVIGGGPIGCELAQAFLLLGVKVTMLEAFAILPRDEKDLVALLRVRLRKQGLSLYEQIKVNGVHEEDGEIKVKIEKDGHSQVLSCSHLLVAAGRKVNVGGLDLEKAGVDYTQKGIKVDARLRSSNKKIYAIGDVAGSYQFTHVANYHAGIAIRNILFRMPAKVDYRVVPWVTYTDIELAHVGMLADEALKKDKHAKVLTLDFAATDRAQAEDALDGKIKVIANKKGQVYGVSILGVHAGELLLPWSMLIREKKTLRSLTDVTVAYPTFSELSKRVAGEFYAPKLLSPFVKKMIRLLLKLPW